MFAKLTDLSKAAIFYGLTFVITVIYVLLLPADGTGLNFVMFMPLLGVLIMLLVVTREGYSATGWAGLGLHRLGLSGWWLALLAPLVILFLSYSLIWGLGIASVALPGGNSSLFEFVLNLLIDSILISSIFVLGEEVGWRGYMLPRLLPLGAIRAVLLSGLLHGIWHFPMIFLTPYYHAEGNRFVVIPLFLLTLTLGGVFYGYLRLTTNSIWPVILFHGVWNTTYSGLNSLIVTDSPMVTEYLAGESGLITLLSAIIVTAGLWYLLRKRPQMAVLAA